jgi:hypothetical protein
MNDKLMLELDFVLKVNTAAGRLLVSMEKEHGEIDFGDAWERWVPVFKEVVRTEIEKRKFGGTSNEEPEVAGGSAAVASDKGRGRPSEDSEDVEEEKKDDGDEPPEEPPSMALRDKFKAKKVGLKKK